MSGSLDQLVTEAAAELMAATAVNHAAISERVIADLVVRNRGTVGGSLCHADPAEDLSAALGALRALRTNGIRVLLGLALAQRIEPGAPVDKTLEH